MLSVILLTVLLESLKCLIIRLIVVSDTRQPLTLVQVAPPW